MSKILVIEDEVPICNSLVEILLAEGFDAMGARDGHTGVRLAQAHQPDLVICDVMMPEVDGYRVLQALRQCASTATIPFIFLTARGARDDLRRGMLLGADDYLTKPCSAKELLAAISTRLQKQALLMQHYTLERQRVEALEETVQTLQPIINASHEILDSFYQELLNPLSTLNIAIHLLKQSPQHPEERKRYLEGLQKNYSHELAMLRQMSRLQSSLTSESAHLIRQCGLA